MRRRILPILLAGGVLAALSPGARAFPVEGAVGFDLRGWSLGGGDGKADLTQVVLPLRIHARPLPALELWLGSAAVSSGMSRRAEADLSGLDVPFLRGEWRPGPEGLRVLFGAGLPVASPAAGRPDRILGSLLAEPVLRWEVPVHGSGTDLYLGALHGFRLPGAAASLGFLWERRGSYETEQGLFDPADDVRVAGGLEKRAAGSLWRVDLAWVSPRTSRLEGRPLLDEGSRWELSLAADHPVQGWALAWGVGWRRYAPSSLEPLPDRGLQAEPGGVWILDLALRRGRGGSVTLSYVSSPDAPTGRNGGYTWELDAGWVHPLGRSLAVEAHAGPAWGRLDNGGTVRGGHLSVTLFGRNWAGSSPAAGGTGEGP